MKYQSLINLILVVGLTGCASHGIRPIACRAIYTKPDMKTILEHGKWRKGMQSCKALLVGMAIHNSSGHSGRRQIEFKDATENDMIDLGYYYKSIRGQVEEEILKQKI